MAQTQPKTPANASAPANAAKDATVEDLYAMIDLLKSDMQQLTRTVGEVGKSKAYGAAETVKDKGRSIKAAGEEQYDALRASAEAYGREAGRYVREQPITALGVAAGLGFLIGMVLTNRR